MDENLLATHKGLTIENSSLLFEAYKSSGSLAPKLWNKTPDDDNDDPACSCFSKMFTSQFSICFYWLQISVNGCEKNAVLFLPKVFVTVLATGGLLSCVDISAWM